MILRDVLMYVCNGEATRADVSDAVPPGLSVCSRVDRPASLTVAYR